MESDFKAVVQPQRRLNLNMKEVVKAEVIKLLDAGMIYPISDSPWVNLVQVVPKKRGMTVVPNEKNELVPTRTVTRWRVYINYRKLNDATRKDHFPLQFIDQMLERLLGHMFYCFLDGLSGYFEIPIAPEDQEKTTFTCPYGTFANRQMPFRLCNAPTTFQLCMMVIFNEMNYPFELMCDASEYVVGAVLGQRKDKHFHPIYYASKTLTIAQENYTITEKELLAVMFAFNKFRQYLILSKVIVYTDHSALRYLLTKTEAKPRLMRNPSMEELDEMSINDKFPEEHLYNVDPYLFRICADQVIRRGVSHSEGWNILGHCHTSPAEGHHSRSRTTKKELESRFYWPSIFRDAHRIDFMGPFPSSKGNTYILVTIDYLSKWVEVQALPTNDARVVTRFLKKLFSRFDTPRALISDRGTHFCNTQLEKVLNKYGVTHGIATPYHPQTSDQVEVANRELKRVLEKIVEKNRRD
ncbi:uncharacterized protein LOC113859441 [Abrus precatorius]|uniref:Uncharacterized protein LOC113859441 n=1 Tax=Abrus precatorius TaxID=3816 RepID=A0A8B8KVN9_ABRPR|nr:uncharacterized protein LOC113859441 [Abrus precatorius]